MQELVATALRVVTALRVAVLLAHPNVERVITLLARMIVLAVTASTNVEMAVTANASVAGVQSRMMACVIGI